MAYIKLSDYFWNKIYFTIIKHAKRENAIRATTALLIYFLVADNEKNLFIIKLNSIFKKYKMRYRKKIIDEILLIYREFYKFKNQCKKRSIEIGTSRQTLLLKIEAECFEKQIPNFSNPEYKDLFLEEINH